MLRDAEQRVLPRPEHVPQVRGGSDVRLGEVRVEVERTCPTISGMRPSEMTGYQ